MGKMWIQTIQHVGKWGFNPVKNCDLLYDVVVNWLK